MSYWIVTGADETTGDDRSERIYAQSADQAESFAREKGLFAASVRPAPVLAMQSKPTAATAAIPDYTGLRAGKTLLMALAVINFIGMAIGVVMIAYALASANLLELTKAMMISNGAAATFGGAIGGIVFLTASAACAALRDIARNSWR